MASTDEQAAPATTCTGCGARIEECSCCGEVDCAAPVCYRCLGVAVGQLMRHPHTHGG